MNSFEYTRENDERNKFRTWKHVAATIYAPVDHQYDTITLYGERSFLSDGHSVRTVFTTTRTHTHVLQGDTRSYIIYPVEFASVRIICSINVCVCVCGYTRVWFLYVISGRYACACVCIYTLYIEPVTGCLRPATHILFVYACIELGRLLNRMYTAWRHCAAAPLHTEPYFSFP